jgi:hypothetical protein
MLELYQAGSEGPQWWLPAPDPVRKLPAAGILDRCRANNTCPKIVEHFGSAEVWALKLTPEWVGTVHTHIALHGGVPYSTFSGADRGVNTLWWRRWSVDGTFCVLFTEQDAYCEVDGPHGLRIFPHASY